MSFPFLLLATARVVDFFTTAHSWTVVSCIVVTVIVTAAPFFEIMKGLFIFLLFFFSIVRLCGVHIVRNLTI
jgi:hypothetical protein